MNDIENDKRYNIAQCCPICYGKGFVPEGFYRSTALNWVGDGGTEQCKACQGKGYIII